VARAVKRRLPTPLPAFNFTRHPSLAARPTEQVPTYFLDITPESLERERYIYFMSAKYKWYVLKTVKVKKYGAIAAAGLVKGFRRVSCNCLSRSAPFIFFSSYALQKTPPGKHVNRAARARGGNNRQGAIF
jgi:hypothetical protein